MKWRGFSMIEILVSLVFISFAFLPIYNLFQFGQRGTASNAKEIEATNYASDLINFVRDQSASELDRIFNGRTTKLKDDAAITSAFKKIGLQAPPPVRKGYTRSMTVKKFQGRNKKGPWGFIGAVSDFLKKRKSVPNYLVTVEIKYPKTGSKKIIEDVTLLTIVMD